MSMTNAAETAFITLLFKNTAWANIGDAGGLLPSVGAGSFYISLHTADPGETGNQTTSEVAYTTYARVAVARSAGGFTVSGDTVSNTAEVAFPDCTAGSATAAWFGIGTDASGAGNLIASGALTAPLAISVGITPKFAIGTMTAVAN